MIRLERRVRPSRLAAVLAPVLAFAATALVGLVLFAVLGKDPVESLRVYFIAPIDNLNGLSEVALKMTPLLLCALGLSLCYRASVWNIGAEGQLVMGGAAAGAVALFAGPDTGAWFVVAVVLAGMLGGMAWAGVTAWLRDSCNASEILVSLMLTYVAQLWLMWLVHGPLKDPQGYNFPYSRMFDDPALVGAMFDGYRVNDGFVVALVAAVVMAVFLGQTRRGFELQVAGLAPAAARFAGFGARQGIWLPLLACGGLSGMAGAFEVAGPIGQLTPSISPGYGFAAIIVAWLARLSPLGCVFSAFLVALLYIGGELSQSRMGLPNAITGVFQGVLLLALLSADTLVRYRIRRRV